MIDIIMVMFDWMPVGVKTLFFAVLVLFALSFFIGLILKVVTLFFRR